MEDSALSVEVHHDFLPEFNRMLPLPAGDEDRYDEEDRRLGRGTRLRVWRTGPADGPTLRAAAEAEVAEAIEQGEVAEDDRTRRIDNVVELLSGDTSIADPPDVDEVALELGRGRELFAKWHGPRHEHDTGPMPPVPYPDRYGKWPGVNWRQAVEHTLKRVSDRRPPREERDELGRRRLVPLTTSDRVARLWLRREKMDEAAAVAAAEEQGRRDSGDAAVAELPTVFDDERQNLLRFLVRYHARGELEVPVSGDPLAEAKLMAELERNWDGYGLSENDRADVVAELIRFVASRRTLTRESRIVPTVGYAIVVDGNGAVVDVAPAGLRLTIEGGQYVLRSRRWPRSVRMAARDFRDWRRSAQAIFDQVGVEVDDEHRRHWKRWWPSLAAQLLKSVEVVEDAQRQMTWEGWLLGIAEAAPMLSNAPTDGSAYRAVSGGFFAAKGWLEAQAVAAGLIGEADLGAFRKWLGKADKNRRDALGVQRKLLALPAKPPLVIGPSHEGDERIEVAGSRSPDDAENEG
jgi:hypothetical protein